MSGDALDLDALAEPLTDAEREAGGRLVREVWVEWACEQPDPKPSWLVEWDDLPEPDREVDRRIAERVVAAARADERERVWSVREAFLVSPDLDPAWIAGWHAAIDHALHALAQPADTNTRADQ